MSNFVKKKQVTNSIKAPLELVHCNECDLLQLKHSAPQELLYKGFYWYRSGVTNTMKKGLKDIFNVGKKVANLQKGDAVLDIGANDGTLLKNFKDSNYYTIGCEPAKNLSKELKKNCKVLMKDFWNFENFTKLQKKYKFKKPKLITAIGMFYDLEDPSMFINDINKALDDDGIFIAQLMCLKSMIEKNDLGNICHEHLEYYSYKSLIYLFENNGFQILKVEENNINSGSYRIFCKKKINPSIKIREKTSLTDIKKFIARVINIKSKCYNFIKLKNKNMKVSGFGASTKGNVLLQLANIDNSLLDRIYDVNKEKFGKLTPITNIKIKDEIDLIKEKQDYLLILIWHFKKFIYKKIARKNKKIKLIIPFPKIKII